MSPPDSDSVIDLSVLTPVETTPATPSVIQSEVLILFDRYGTALLRYVSSFGLSPQETEDIVQEVFLSLFRHLHLGRDQHNLKGWLFQVAHNLALKQRRNIRRQRVCVPCDEASLTQVIDSAPNPEACLAHAQRRQRLLCVVHALPERDRRCLFLRSEGLRYREIAAALGVSLGAVSKSLTRAITRLLNADGG